MPSNTDFLKIHPVDPERLYPLKEFDQLVLSYCASTPPKTSIEVQARVQLTDGRMTQWFSWGIWSPFADRHSINSSDEFAAMDTDTLTLKNDLLAHAVQVRILAQGNTPAVDSIYLAVKNRKAPCEETLPVPRSISVPTPGYSQMVRDSRIGGVICSATTIAMLLGQKGENVLPEEIALHNYDSAYDGCGNWSFSTACAASYGYEAYLRFADLQDVYQELSAGHAVGASVQYTKDPDHPKLPYLENAPCNTFGHLLVICGFETDAAGRSYVIAHDPAAESNAAVERRYPLEQFLRAWSNRLIYVVHPSSETATRTAPVRVPATLKKAQMEETFELFSNGEPIHPMADSSFPSSVICWITDRKGMYDADCDFAYGSVTPDGLLNLPGYNGEELFVITNRGTIYHVPANNSI